MPLFVEVDGHVVEGGGCGGVDAHGASGKGRVTGCGGAPESLCHMRCKALAVELS